MICSAWRPSTGPAARSRMTIARTTSSEVIGTNMPWDRGGFMSGLARGCVCVCMCVCMCVKEPGIRVVLRCGVCVCVCGGFLDRLTQAPRNVSIPLRVRVRVRVRACSCVCVCGVQLRRHVDLSCCHYLSGPIRITDEKVIDPRTDTWPYSPAGGRRACVRLPHMVWADAVCCLAHPGQALFCSCPDD